MYAVDIIKLTRENTNFRTVLQSGKNAQIVAMSIPVDEDIGKEVHSNVDQILIFVDGKGVAILNGETNNVEEHDVVFVPAGVTHNFKNTGDKELKLFTVYAPPEHPDGTIHKTKEEAQQAEEIKKGH